MTNSNFKTEEDLVMFLQYKNDWVTINQIYKGLKTDFNASYRYCNRLLKKKMIVKRPVRANGRIVNAYKLTNN